MATAKSKGEYWRDIIIAVIALVSALASAWLAARSTSKSETTATIAAYEEKYRNLERVRIQTGVEVGQTDDSGWTLDAAIDGQHVHSKYLPFSEPFTADPQVTTALTAIDASNASNLRVLVFPTRISWQGFELRVQTWGDTKLHFVQVTWTAFQQGL